jgi:lactoylglutathione lyase
MRYAFTILYVPDVPATVDFYERAFGLERKMIVETGDYAELTTGLAFAAHDIIRELGPQATAKPAGFEIWLQTEDVPAAVERATAAGAELVMKPTVKPWGQTVAYVRDLNGTLVELGTPVG